MENIITRVKLIVLQPKQTWEVIKTEDTSLTDLLIMFVLPLSLIPSIASFIGYGFIGLIGGNANIESGLSHSVNMFLSTFAGILISAWVIALLAPNFGTILKMDNAIILVAYSYIPTLLAGIFYLIPALSVLAIVGSIYSLYVLYYGFKPITNVSEEQKSNYFLLSILSSIVVFVVISYIFDITLTYVGLASNI